MLQGTRNLLPGPISRTRLQSPAGIQIRDSIWDEEHSYVNPELGARPHPGRRQSQYSWAQIRLAAYILGSRPSAQVPEGYLPVKGC